MLGQNNLHTFWIDRNNKVKSFLASTLCILKKAASFLSKGQSQVYVCKAGTTNCCRCIHFADLIFPGRKKKNRLTNQLVADLDRQRIELQSCVALVLLFRKPPELFPNMQFVFAAHFISRLSLNWTEVGAPPGKINNFKSNCMNSSSSSSRRRAKSGLGKAFHQLCSRSNWAPHEPDLSLDCDGVHPWGNE